MSVFQLRINLLKYHVFIYYLLLYFFVEAVRLISPRGLLKQSDVILFHKQKKRIRSISGWVFVTGSAFNPRDSGNFTACCSLEGNVCLFTFGDKRAQLRPRQRVDNVWLWVIVITLTGNDLARGCRAGNQSNIVLHQASRAFCVSDGGAPLFG